MILYIILFYLIVKQNSVIKTKLFESIICNRLYFKVVIFLAISFDILSVYLVKLIVYNKILDDKVSLLEKVLISDIFYVEGRERPEDYDVSSQKLAEAIKTKGVDAVYGGDLKETEKQIRELADQFDVIMVLGAGNIYEVAKNLVK